MKFNKYCKTAVIVLFISSIIFSFSHHIGSFKQAYIYENLYQQIKFACGENLFEKYADMTVSEYNGIKLQNGNKAYTYNKKVKYNGHDYRISYINFNDKNSFIYPCAFIKSNFGNANLTIYFYYDYYSIQMLYNCDSHSFSTLFNINLDFDTKNLSLEDEENYKKTLKVISENIIKESIEVFNNQAKKDMDTIYNNIK